MELAYSSLYPMDIKEKKLGKRIAVLGATGSVGMQALDIARARGYTVDMITASRNACAAEAAVREFSPRFVAMADESAAAELAIKIKDTGTKVLSGASGILFAIRETDAETVVNSILGEAGLMPTLEVIDTGKRLALANKESLVIAGDIVMSRLRERGGELIPVDSEHSAIFQSLKSGRGEEIRRIILTASGGPFFGKTREELRSVTLQDTLAHPTWKMGAKITVDSATLMNKGFEVIEAVHLFGVPKDKVEVVVHRESILHSAVEYIDNSIIGEMSPPDMRMCVQYAVDYPDRCPTHLTPLDFFSVGKLTFYRPDTEAFPLLALAARAIGEGGAMPAIVNALDEVAVGAFLREKIPFYMIPEIVLSCYERMTAHKCDMALEAIIAADREARLIADELIRTFG